MTAQGKRYVDLAAELKALNGNTPRYAEIVGELDRIWARISEPERKEIDSVLIAIDESTTSNEHE